MFTARRLHHSYEQYLQLLQLSPVKLEYCDGEIYAMAGRTPAHADLAAAVTHLLVRALGADCRVSSSDLKVRIEATGLTTFPDVTVVCGPRELSGLDAHAVTDPTLLVEVTSQSTEDYYRGEKLSNYKQLPSLRAVLLVSHRRPHVTVVVRVEGGWDVRELGMGEELVLDEPRLRFTVAELYRGIELEAVND